MQVLNFLIIFGLACVVDATFAFLDGDSQIPGLRSLAEEKSEIIIQETMNTGVPLKKIVYKVVSPAIGGDGSGATEIIKGMVVKGKDGIVQLLGGRM